MLSKNKLNTVEITQLIQERDFDKAFQKIDDSIQVYQKKLSEKPQCKSSRVALMTLWKVISDTLFVNTDVQLPTHSAKKIQKFPSLGTLIVDNFIENDWKSQCTGKFGGPKPKSLSWKQFYFESESQVDQLEEVSDKIRWCVEKGHIKYLKFLQEEDVNLDEIQYPDKASLVSKAIAQDYSALALYLLDQKCPANTVDDSGWTPVHYAVNNGNLALLKQLLKSKININAKCKQGLTPLHVAAIKNSNDCLFFLLSEGSKTTIKDKRGYTPLYYALFNLDTIAVERLLDYGGDINLKDPFGRTFLHWAVTTGNEHIVKLIINNNIMINAKDMFGRTALHYAAQAGHMNCINTLLTHECQPSIQDKFQQTPLRIAAFWGNGPVTAVLHEAGAR